MRVTLLWINDFNQKYCAIYKLMKDPAFKVVNRLLISLIHSNAKRIYFNLLLTFSLLFSRVQKVLYDLAMKMQSCIALFTLLVFHHFTSLHTPHFPTLHFTSHSSFFTCSLHFTLFIFHSPHSSLSTEPSRYTVVPDEGQGVTSIYNLWWCTYRCDG